MSVPTVQEEYAKLLEYLVKSQESCAMIAHLTRAQGSKKDDVLATGWLGISELLKRIQTQITKLAMGRMN